MIAAVHDLESCRAQFDDARPTNTLLARLEGVQRSGKGYRVLFPACGGKGRELTLSEHDDGNVLMKCFCCHDTPGVFGAPGLSLAADLCPQRIKDTTPDGCRAAQRAFKQSAWGAALRVLAIEAAMVEVAAAMTRVGEALGDDDIDRLHLASPRIHVAHEVLQ